MRAYTITLPSGKAFTYITDEPEINIPDAVFERFGVWPVKVLAL